MSMETSIPCPFKKLIESRTVEELRSISEQLFSSDIKEDTKKRGVLQERKDDLCSLMYKMLPMKDSDTSFSSLKTPLAAWQVCVSAKQHEGGYQHDTQSLDTQATNRTAAFQKCPEFFTPPRCNNLTDEDLAGENNCDNVKEIRVKSASLAVSRTTRQDGGSFQRHTRSASCPGHTGFKFYHSYYTGFYMKSYREQIADQNVKKHIRSRLKEMNSRAIKKPLKKIHEVKKKAIPKPTFTLYRFRIKDRGAQENDILKVGPCPTMPEQAESKKAGLNSNTATLNRSKNKPQANVASKAEINERKDVKSVTTIEFQKSAPALRENVVSGPNSEERMKDSTKLESTGGKLKKVQLKVHDSTESPRIVSKGRPNKSKARVLGVCMKPSLQWTRHGSEMSYERKVPRKPTLGEKEFLRITTPKPLMGCQSFSQTSSDFDESPSFSPDKSMEESPVRSPVSSVSNSSLRNQVIADILMKREPQVVFPKKSNFQACITPSNYSTSSVDSHFKQRRAETPVDIEQDLTEESDHNRHQVSRMPSKPSFPKIGPFISG